MPDARDRYYCRDCFAAVTDSRTKEARDRGLNMKCPNCGGVCDPLAETIETLDKFRRRAAEQRAGLSDHHYFGPDESPNDT